MQGAAALKILCVATKLPWPPVDGGRLVLWQMLEALAAAGHAIRLVVPGNSNDVDPATMRELLRVCTPHLVPVWPRSWARAALSAVLRNRALTVSRHRHRAVQQVIARLLESWQPDLVHAEQLQAWANCTALKRSKAPLVLRMQNVESALWQQAAASRWRSRGLWLEALRLRIDERKALLQAAAVITLTERDALALRRIAGSAHAAKIRCIGPAFVAEQTAGMAMDDGIPAVVIAGSAGWWPNTQATRWFVEQILPRLRALHPGVKVHAYGGEPVRAAGLHWHEAPAQSIDAFPADAIVALPLLIGSGIRMRILEAWARGLPVVATSVAAAGLAVQDGGELLLADSAEAFARALDQLLRDAALRRQLVASGRAYLRQHHDPIAQGRALLDCYQAVLPVTSAAGVVTS